uniref:Uncharacterized protein n=1 Tax=Candidatus Kentrum sp. FM TaxID=2126340 RepID=A0A450RV27_9GAMM|nr:MAG: hypothetical protein BECKFM1743A_GA0114220_1000325 [Candidatus Kentron sp. FM]VFJ43681.1 MAG: hypothetical protein BECKFM1743C_GA0114222_1000325 [Candidatus Kentron sp. FM]VFK05679.1 MAG: hypothetical protein BECKFM1743B_GA0114221_1000325 [Candidatus Kentron sp. FM]
MMNRYFTERANILNASEKSPSEKVCLAASDYKRAIHDADFVCCHGSIEAFRHDLLEFVEEWEATL